MEDRAKIVYDNYIKYWTESGIYRGYPSISKGLSEFLKECANQIYWSEIQENVTNDSWTRFRDLLEDLANEIEETYKFHPQK